jgi:hypothetical protein
LALTLFSIPKPFEGHIGVIQQNAIASWRLLDPNTQILLFGDETGTAAVANEFGAIHIPEIARNSYGTPLLHTVFSCAREMAENRLLCYVNTDIILLKNFLEAGTSIRFKSFLMVGRRWRLQIHEPIDFSSTDWEQRLLNRVHKNGILDLANAVDYFLFPKGLQIGDFPPFAVGRPGWDNWLVFKARKLGIPVVDVTQRTLVVHQDHDYHHVPSKRGDSWEGPEADRNRSLVGDLNRIFTLQDATHIMTRNGVRLALTFPYLKRRWQTMSVLHPSFAPIVGPVSNCFNFFRKTFLSYYGRNKNLPCRPPNT